MTRANEARRAQFIRGPLIINEAFDAPSAQRAHRNTRGNSGARRAPQLPADFHDWLKARTFAIGVEMTLRPDSPQICQVRLGRSSCNRATALYRERPRRRQAGGIPGSFYRLLPANCVRGRSHDDRTARASEGWINAATENSLPRSRAPDTIKRRYRAISLLLPNVC